MRLLDANILIRYLTNDHPRLASKCEALFRKISEGKEKVLLTHLVIAEVVWVLEGQYHFPPEKISEVILRLLNTNHVELDEKDVVIQAFSMWELSRYRVDYIDAYHAAWIAMKKLNGIYSYDSDFEKLGVERLEP